jgi:thiol-disulfide isomerase/thioredoxin
MPTSKQAKARSARLSGPNRGLLIGLIAGAVVLVAAVLAVALTSGDDDSAESPSGVAQKETGTVTVTGQALPVYDANVSPDPGIGQTIPTIEGQNFAGEPVAISDDGKAKVILYAAHWCPHCQKEVPIIAASLAASALPANVDMYLVSAAGQPTYPNYPASEWLAGVNWPTSVLVDDADSAAAQALGVSAYPYFVFVDANNKVVNRVSGEIPVEDFRARVEAVAAT